MHERRFKKLVNPALAPARPIVLVVHIVVIAARPLGRPILPALVLILSGLVLVIRAANTRVAKCSPNGQPNRSHHAENDESSID